VTGLSGGSQLDCAVVGNFTSPSGRHAYVWSAAGGSTPGAQQLSGIAGSSDGDAVACAGDRCVAGGQFQDASGKFQAFVAGDAGGTWGPVLPISGGLNIDNADVPAASCAAPDTCAVGGSFTNSSGRHAFVADKSPATRTSLTLSPPKITYGREQAERITVSVTPRTGGTPSGTVLVTAGSGRLCTITLAKGTGTCALAAAMLRPGSYQLTATYGGDAVYAGSTSGQKPLTVAPEPTATTLKLSAPMVKSAMSRPSTCRFRSGRSSPAPRRARSPSGPGRSRSASSP
jgi:hypothetical protein